MVKELKRPNGLIYATLTYEKENKLLFLHWKGFLQVEQLKQGSEELLKMMQETKCVNVLVSNRDVSGPWNDAGYMKWAQNDWNPRAIKAGLKYMAILVSDNVFAQMSLQGFEKITVGAYTTRSFNSEVSARDWLKEVILAAV
jgi:hypothetical protein